MITSILIENFRGFSRLDVPMLPQVALLTGRNGSGKTTLLEAAFAIYARNPPVWLFNLQARRGLARITAQGPQYTGLFGDFQAQGRANISGEATDGHRYRVELERESGVETAALTTSSATGDAWVSQPQFVCRAFCDSDLENKSSISWVVDKEGKARLEVEKVPPKKYTPLLQHSGTREAVGEEEAMRFGNARAAGRTKAILSGLRIMEPSIKDVEFLKTDSGENFYARLESGLVPLGLLGGGINNVFRHLVSFDYTQGGFLGIDEVENGIHHTLLPDLFRSLVQSAFETHTHLMMSTHSADAVTALSKVVQEFVPGQKEQIGAIHIQRLRDGKVVLTPFVGDAFVSQVELGYELR